MSGAELAGHLLVPDWAAPPGVRAAFTLRSGGVSRGSWGTLNLGAHVGDAPEAVRENRRRVRAGLDLAREPAWLGQVHGVEVADLDVLPAGSASEGHPGAHPPRADAALTRQRGLACAVLVADCMPVLFAARDGSAVAAAHAGWRGLAAGVLEATVAALGVPPRELVAWLGPAIGPRHFEVGPEVRDAFAGREPADAPAFQANARGRWQCDLVALARARLERLGLPAPAGGAWCTYADAERFFSHRRDGQCGRMAALVWRTARP